MVVTAAQVKTEARRSVHVSKSPQAVGLLSVAAVLSLIMWYIFSFLTLFMNKYTLDALQAEPFLFCEYHVACWLLPHLLPTSIFTAIFWTNKIFQFLTGGAG